MTPLPVPEDRLPRQGSAQRAERAKSTFHRFFSDPQSKKEIDVSYSVLRRMTFKTESSVLRQKCKSFTVLFYSVDFTPRRG